MTVSCAHLDTHALAAILAAFVTAFKHATARSKWPSVARPQLRPQLATAGSSRAASEGLGLPSALGRRGLAPQITAGSDGSSATRRPSRHSHRV